MRTTFPNHQPSTLKKPTTMNPTRSLLVALCLGLFDLMATTAQAGAQMRPARCVGRERERERDVVVEVARHEGVLAPLSAVLFEPGGAVVQVVHDGVVETRRVSVGRSVCRSVTPLVLPRGADVSLFSVSPPTPDAAVNYPVTTDHTLAYDARTAPLQGAAAPSKPTWKGKFNRLFPRRTCCGQDGRGPNRNAKLRGSVHW